MWCSVPLAFLGLGRGITVFGILSFLLYYAARGMIDMVGLQITILVPEHCLVALVCKISIQIDLDEAGSFICWSGLWLNCMMG